MDEADVQQRARSFIASVGEVADGDLNPYVSKVGAKVVFEEMGKGESGTTITKPNGKHIITVNSTESPARQRFTICHEVAHLALELGSSHEEVPSWSFAKRDASEIACDTFAAELLMPYQKWLQAVPPGEPSFEVIEKMREAFQVSFPAAASRYATLSGLPCAFVTMERGTVRYAARSTSLRRVGAWISPRSPIPAGSISANLRAGEMNAIESGEVAQDIWFENWEHGQDLQELSRHYYRTDTTIALLWFDEEDLPLIEVDRFGTKVQEDEGLSELTGELSWPGKRKRR